MHGGEDCKMLMVHAKNIAESPDGVGFTISLLVVLIGFLCVGLLSLRIQKQLVRSRLLNAVFKPDAASLVAFVIPMVPLLAAFLLSTLLIPRHLGM